MKNKNKAIYQPIPEGCNRESQPCQKEKAAEMPDKGIRAWYNGFTLIELLVVVLIIGVLAAVAVPQYNKVIWKSRAAQIIPVVRALAEAEKRYLLANGTYTGNFDELDLKFTQSTGYEEKKNYWTLHIHNIRSSQRVFAEINRFGNPWFYISYDLANNWLECMPEGDGGKEICKLFSKTEPYSCTGATYETYKCYRIQ